MRVVHVGLETTTSRPGGLNRYLENLVLAQRRAGLDAVGVELGDATDLGGNEAFVVAGSPRASVLRRARQVDGAVRSLGRPDVADVHFAGTAAVPVLLGALRGVPTVVHFQGPWADESRHAGAAGWNVALKRTIERAVYRRAERVVVLSGAFGEVLASRYGVAPWSIEVLAPGVDLDRFAPADRDTARTTLGVAADRVALAVRRLVPRMGLEVLLEAWRRLEPGSADLLAIVGSGPEAEALSELAASLGIAATVRFCRDVSDDELVAWYRAVDVTVVPSVALEGFGLVVLESAACGTPVVGTDAGGLGEALGLVGLGPPVPAGDVAALAIALEAALVAPPPEERQRLRAAAEEHSWDAVAAAHVALYERVVSSERRRRVLVLDHTGVLSGGELALVRALGGVRDAVDVHVVLGSEGPLRARLQSVGATVEVLAMDEAARTVHRGAVRPGGVGPRELAHSAAYVVRLARRIATLRPDVVHTNSLKAALYGGVAARLAGVPCVWHVRDRIDEAYLPRPAVRMVRAAARVLPTIVVANSASTLATLQVVDGRVVPSPLDPSISATSRAAARGRPLRVTALGRLAAGKGQHLALEAFALAFPGTAETLRVVGADLFGEGDYAATLPVLATHLGIDDRVTFEGFVDDVADVLDATDVLVHTSTSPEPFGQVVLEAMGAGAVVVVADRGGPAELVTDGVDGLLYPMGDVDALAECLRRLAGDATLRDKLGAAAVATSLAYTPEALAPRLLDAWDAAIAKRRVRRRRARSR